MDVRVALVLAALLQAGGADSWGEWARAADSWGEWARAAACAGRLGPARCVKLLALSRGARALGAAERGRATRFHLREDLQHLPWERFVNTSEAQLDAALADYTARLFGAGRDLVLSFTGGIELDVHSHHNGSMRLDVKKDANTAVSARRRGSSWRRRFYRLVPLMLIPPLIMAAILPFKLPAFMMMSMGAVLLNNVAFTGSIFTLLRNNAFDDDYEKRVVYVNDGYKNEAPMERPMNVIPETHSGFHESTFFDGHFGNEEGPVNSGGFTAINFPYDAYSSDNHPQSYHGDTFIEHSEPVSTKVKKRRGQKHKRKPGSKKKPVEEGWEESFAEFSPAKLNKEQSKKYQQALRAAEAIAQAQAEAAAAAMAAGAGGGPGAGAGLGLVRHSVMQEGDDDAIDMDYSEIRKSSKEQSTFEVKN